MAGGPLMVTESMETSKGKAGMVESDAAIRLLQHPFGALGGSIYVSPLHTALLGSPAHARKFSARPPSIR